MDSKEFKKLRNKLNKTQQQLAPLLGVSVKAVHSYEQGWLNIPPHVERQMLFLLSRMDGNPKARRPCWVKKNAILQLRCAALAGNLIRQNYAGLLTVTFTAVKYVRPGKRK